MNETLRIENHNCPPLEAGSCAPDFLVDRILADMGGEIPGRTRARLYTEPGGTNPVDQHLLQELFVISFPLIQTSNFEIFRDTVRQHHHARGLVP